MAVIDALHSPGWPNPLAGAIAALAGGRAPQAIAAITAAERALREAAPLWSFVATIQPEAFLTFREFTEGASAIQSRSYKTVESLCRRPDDTRLDSPAYRSVPDVRERVLAGRTNLVDALTAAPLTTDMSDRVRAAMEGFATALLKWRQSHCRLAVRMLGERPGHGLHRGRPLPGEGAADPRLRPGRSASRLGTPTRARAP